MDSPLIITGYDPQTQFQGERFLGVTEISTHSQSKNIEVADSFILGNTNDQNSIIRFQEHFQVRGVFLRVESPNPILFNPQNSSAPQQFSLKGC